MFGRPNIFGNPTNFRLPSADSYHPPPGGPDSQERISTAPFLPADGWCFSRPERSLWGQDWWSVENSIPVSNVRYRYRTFDTENILKKFRPLAEKRNFLRDRLECIWGRRWCSPRSIELVNRIDPFSYLNRSIRRLTKSIDLVKWINWFGWLNRSIWLTESIDSSQFFGSAISQNPARSSKVVQSPCRW